MSQRILETIVFYFLDAKDAKQLKRWFVACMLVLTWVSAAAYAQETMPPVYYYVDKTGNQSVEQLLDKEPSYWNVLPSDGASFGYTSDVYCSI